MQYYEHLLFEQHAWKHSGWFNFFNIRSTVCRGLERPFEEDEVCKVIYSMVSDKTPGPDGFTRVFFQVCWEVIKGDLMRVFQDFHTNARFEVLMVLY